MKSELNEPQVEFQPFIEQFESKNVKEVQKAVIAISKKITDAKVCPANFPIIADLTLQVAQAIVSTAAIMNFFKQRLLTKDGVKVNVAICKTLLKIADFGMVTSQTTYLFALKFQNVFVLFSTV
jgi:hypothetical protein